MSRDGIKIGFVVNDVDTEVPTAATTVMAHTAAAKGHTVYMTGVGDLTYHVDGSVGAEGRPAAAADTQAAFLHAVQGRAAPRVKIPFNELDVLYLRYNPVENLGESMWEQDAGIVFGQVALNQGVMVLSDPYTLAFAVNKMYFEHFPESVRPRTVITRSVDEILKFYKQEKGRVVLKPMHGYGGKDVYLLKGDTTNLKQIVETISRNSYVIAQEYLPAASKGDIRLFLINGRPVLRDGKYAAIHRVNTGGDFRSNMSAGAKPHKAKITDRILEIAETVRPKIVADGLFFVGLDVVGDKLVEINTISAGGLNAASKLEGVNFGEDVIRAIERKVAHKRAYGSALSNRQLATMD